MDKPKVLITGLVAARPKFICHFPGHLSQADAVHIADKCLSHSSTIALIRFPTTNTPCLIQVVPKKCLIRRRPVRRMTSISANNL